MALINVLVFKVLKILHDLLFAQISLFANNFCRNQDFEKSAQADIAFILNELSEMVNCFA